MSLDRESLQQWVGQTESVTDVIAPWPVRALTATLDRDDAPGPGEPLPPGWHWLYFLPTAKASEIAADGHPRRGGFLPPVPLPRRMWAGSRLVFHQPLLVGEPARRESSIVSVEPKSGRSGSLVFVLVRHRIFGPKGLAIEDEHDIVYRAAPVPGAPAPKPEPAPADALWRREIAPDPVLLFRYSALTFNAHRIHYDHPYVTEIEGYPGVIVHGPLIATLLLDLVRREVRERPLVRFEFKALSPLYMDRAFTVCGRPEPEADGARVWAAGPDGLAMMASARFGR